MIKLTNDAIGILLVNVVYAMLTGLKVVHVK